MGFDHKAYWADKIAKQRLSVQREMNSIFRWGRFFEGIFSNDGFVAFQGTKPIKKGHTRSLKERRMRRLAHKMRVRT
jgi:hypothetical protein